MCLLFSNFGLKRLLVFRANLLPLRVFEVVLFNFTTVVLQIWIFEAKLTHLKCYLSRKKKLPEYLDEGDFGLACLRTCEGNLWETIFGCIIEDHVLAGVAVLVA